MMSYRSLGEVIGGGDQNKWGGGLELSETFDKREWEGWHFCNLLINSARLITLSKQELWYRSEKSD